MNAENSMKMSRSFNWHNMTQFLGAMNDNIFQFFLIFFLTGLLGAGQKEQINSWAGIIFVVPFLLFTPFAGVLADRFSKRTIIVNTKIAELAIMLLGWVVFLFSGQMGRFGVVAVYGVLFLMCTQSSFFGPCKYSIIPELVEREKLSRANSYLQGMSYLAIICGTALAPFTTDLAGGHIAIAGVLCVLVSIAGVYASFHIHRVPPAKEDVKVSFFFMKHIFKALHRIRHDRFLILAVLASAYFLLIGGFAKIVLIPYGMEYCQFSVTRSGYLFVVAALGIGAGSYFAGRLSGRTVEVGIVPLGALGLAVTAIGLGLTASLAPNGSLFVRVMTFVLIAVFGLSAGLFIVPINAFIQLRAPDEVRGRVLASSSFLGWIGVLLAAVMYNVLSGLLKVPLSFLFLGMGTLTLILAVGTVILLPDFLVRLVVVLLTRTIYRIKVVGEDNIPIEGPALIVSNHVSWADAVVLGATQQRRIRFVMDRAIYENRLLHWLFKLQKAIPISATDPPKKIVAALQEARQAMDDGYLVCIFAEGMLTRTGMLGRFHAGFEKIVKHTNYPIIPTYLGGLWGSILSHYHGKLMSAWPKQLPCPVSVHFGTPIPANANPQDIRWAIEQLSGDYFNDKQSSRHSLGETLVQAARKHWREPFLSDSTGKKLTFGETLTAATLLADTLEPKTDGQQNIGIFLPSSVAGALANFGVALMNKTAVNMSYKASEGDREYILDTAEIKTVLTSRAFLEKIEIPAEALPGAVLMEDLLEGFTDSDKRKAFIKARLIPRRKLARVGDTFSADATAIILFTSGSSGRPKGVELSHHNIQSDIECALMVFRVLPGDKLCGILPFFHSFGLTCTLWLPLIAGVPACFVPNPLDGKMVGDTIRTEQATLLFSTPTFLLNYLRRCAAEDLQTLRFIVAGAEKLKTKLIDAFEKKFGVRPCEGYGATECAPLISFNVPDVEVAGGKQIGTKEGTVGHTIPGLAVRVLDVNTGEPVDHDEPGLLYVKGPNVMKGYLKLPDKTGQVLNDGWYNTGDVVSIDEDGFMTIRDRLSRFSKIGGEMVPHMTIEEVVLKGLEINEPIVAVTSIPDEKKGEQLVILYEQGRTNAEAILSILDGSDLPKLYIPRRENVIGVDEIPRLGSGKLDMMKLRQMALDIKKESKNDP